MKVNAQIRVPVKVNESYWKLIFKCHNVTISNIATFLGFCHTVCIFFSFFSKTYKCHKFHKSAASTGLFLDVPQISTFRSYVSLSFGSDKSIILILATFTF